MNRTDYWQRIYQRLHAHGYTDEEIATQARVGRQVICRVRNGTWPWNHDLKSLGAVNIERLLQETKQQGELPLAGDADDA